MADCIDYKKMWKTLKGHIKSGKEYYSNGTMCSFGESVYGKAICEDVLEIMEILERKVGIEE